MAQMTFQFDDGGRAAAGYKGTTGDCACRAIAIASGRPYQEIYDLSFYRHTLSYRCGRF